MKAQLQNHSLSFHELCSLFHLGFSPFTIRLSSYSHELSLECTWRFSTICLKYGLTIYPPPLDSFFFFFHYHHFFLSSPLVRIYCSPPFKVQEILIILGLGIQQRGPRLGNFILTCRMLDAKFIEYLLT